MALETTRGSLAALIATEKLAATARAAHLPRLPFSQLIHQDSIDGDRAPQKRYMVESNLGRSAGGTEGISLNNTVEIGMATSINVVTSEGVADQALVTEDAVMEALGISSAEVAGVFADGTQEQFERILAPIVQRLIPRGLEKIEYDALQKILDLTNSVGAITANASLLNGLQAIYQFQRQSPLRPMVEARFMVDPSVVFEWNLEAGITSGGVQGAVWVNQANYGLLSRLPNDYETNGFAGTLLGYQVHCYSPEVAPEVVNGGDTGVAGLFGHFVMPTMPPDAPALGGKPASFVYLERSPLRLRFDMDISARGAKVVMNARYGHGCLAPLGAVRVLSKKRTNLTP